MGMIALYCVFGGLGLFMLYMLIVTASMGTERLKVPQFLMSSLTYSEEATIKLNLLIDKYEAGLLSITRDDKHLFFTDVETNAKAGCIWVGNRYYAYGNLFRYGANENKEWSCNKPDIKTFKRIIKLEKSLEKTSSNNDSAPRKDARESGEEVILG